MNYSSKLSQRETGDEVGTEGSKSYDSPKEDKFILSEKNNLYVNSQLIRILEIKTTSSLLLLIKANLL